MQWGERFASGADGRHGESEFCLFVPFPQGSQAEVQVQATSPRSPRHRVFLRLARKMSDHSRARRAKPPPRILAEKQKSWSRRPAPAVLRSIIHWYVT